MNGLEIGQAIDLQYLKWCAGFLVIILVAGGIGYVMGRGRSK